MPPDCSTGNCSWGGTFGKLGGAGVSVAPIVAVGLGSGVQVSVNVKVAVGVGVLVGNSIVAREVEVELAVIVADGLAVWVGVRATATPCPAESGDGLITTSEVGLDSIVTVSVGGTTSTVGVDEISTWAGNVAVTYTLIGVGSASLQAASTTKIKPTTKGFNGTWILTPTPCQQIRAGFGVPAPINYLTKFSA